ncbi:MULTISPECIES: hypothetical protein [unclassified Bradyrhizobium]|uniref:hypothetical protein n=1 Tax=unclassified Bradyrhizobium TaxID=2631580 RepID=UPI002479025A|nr:MULTISPECIES: hypothetical protein [unclassified Bradyrhizobium]WGS17664.1 hypothetical protein MTX22_23870 [Bradyrhizobium sp. ISRA463]WGS24454.1 hypothetical protein MTX19_21535 [Bradyrhizobium sp. ISRA464]
MSAVGNGNMGVGNEPATRAAGQQQMAGAMPQQGARVMGENECAPQQLVRLVGCRDSKVNPERSGFKSRAKQFGQTNR